MSDIMDRPYRKRARDDDDDEEFGNINPDGGTLMNVDAEIIPRHNEEVELGAERVVLHDENVALDAEDVVRDEEPLPRDEYFWYEDGDVTLIVEDTEFRIHAHILTDNSPVFDRLLSDYWSAGGEGCPVLRLRDTHTDIAYMIAALYGGFQDDPDAVCQLWFTVVDSLVRMGHRYEIYELRDHALERIKTCYPADFSSTSWDNFSAGVSDVMITDDEDAVAVVNLARLTRAHWLLPMALYKCCSLDSSVLAFGAELEDGRVEMLSEDDMLRCFRARTRLLSATSRRTQWLFDVRCDYRCTQPDVCRKILDLLARRAHRRHRLATIAALDPLLPDLHAYSRTLCTACWDMLDREDKRVRWEMFANLPRYLGLVGEVDDWPEGWSDDSDDDP